MSKGLRAFEKVSVVTLVLGAAVLVGSTCTDDQVAACEAEPDCIVVRPDPGTTDLKIGDELQRAWNQLVFANPGNPPAAVAFTMPAHTQPWIVEKRVRFCLSDTPPADMDEPPVCDGPGYTGTIAFGGQFDYLCAFDGPISEIPALTGLGFFYNIISDTCLWVGNASNGAVAPPTPAGGPTLVGSIHATSGQAMTYEPYSFRGLTPFFCDGCGQYDEFVLVHGIDPNLTDPLGLPEPLLLPGLRFIGGSGDLTIYQSGPNPNGIGTNGVGLGGQHDGTVIHGLVNGMGIGRCTYAGAPYDCNVELASDLTILNPLFLADGGDITSDATIVLPATHNKPAVVIGNDGLGAGNSDPIGRIDIGGRLVKGEIALNGCIRLDTKTSTWQPDGLLTVRAACENRFGLFSPPATHLAFETGLVACRAEDDYQALSPRRVRIESSAHYEIGAVAGLDWEHTISPFPRCAIEGDAGNQSDYLASLPSATPAGGAPVATGTVVGATNGNYHYWREHPTITVTGDLTAVVPGDRLRFLGDPATDGPLAGTSRPVLAVAGDVITLGDWRLDPADSNAEAEPAFALGLDFAIERPACFDFLDSTWKACGSTAGTKLTAADPLYATEGRVLLDSGGPDGDVSCALTWVRRRDSGPDAAGDQIGAEIHFGLDETERPSFLIGADASWNVAAALDVPDASEERLLGDGVAPDEWIELQLTPGPEIACRDYGQPGVTCGCFGGKDLGVLEVALTTIAEDVNVCSTHDPGNGCNWGGPGGF